MFERYILDTETNLFDQLESNVKWDIVTKGRKGAVLVAPINNYIPIVRTTTAYNNPVQSFLSIHYNLIEKIKQKSKKDDIYFNNAMIEVYDKKYRNMKYHSDQTLDLKYGSYIGIYSCYNTDEPKDIRKLKVVGKEISECFEIEMVHNSVILFNTFTNRKYLHKIVLEKASCDDKWLGITFRCSDTFVKFINEKPYITKTFNPKAFYNIWKEMRMANDEERRQYYKLRGEENKKVLYCYFNINYTISPSDILPIKSDI